MRTKKPIAMSMPRNRNSRSAWICASVGTGTSRRGVFESPACGPAAVTNVPAISSAYMTTAMTICSPRAPAGTSQRAGPSPSLSERRSSTANHTSTIETMKWTETLHHTSPSRTVAPPMTACASTPPTWIAASVMTRRRRGLFSTAAIRHRPVMMPMTPNSVRLPNSTHWCSAATSGCSTGTMLPGTHSGHVGQPSPEPVTRTMDPVTAIPPCAMMAAIARARCRGTRKAVNRDTRTMVGRVR